MIPTTNKIHVTEVTPFENVTLTKIINIFIRYSETNMNVFTYPATFKDILMLGRF